LILHGKSTVLKRKFISLAGVFALVIMLSGWGYIGHYKITEVALESVKDKIEGFDTWIAFIADHASDPDYRKSWSTTESPKHYIDVDNYPEYQISGSINTNYDSVSKQHGETFIKQQGILPWATKAAFDSLRYYFEVKDWYHAKLQAADLCHYVGDGHMPLHLTHNYDGQESGNKGIHSRYESKMIIAFSDKISGKVKPAEYINDVTSFIFDYLYQSNRLTDSIFKADNLANQITGGTESPEYLSVLWKNTADMTTRQFYEASFALSSLIYTAWIQAGSPNLKEIVPTSKKQYNCEITSTFQNPNDSTLTINYHIFTEGSYKIDIRNSDGGFALKAGNWERIPGNYSVDVDWSSLSGGSYLVILSCANYASTAKAVKVR
jgi:hypothetical protein